MASCGSGGTSALQEELAKRVVLQDDFASLNPLSSSAPSISDPPEPIHYGPGTPAASCLQHLHYVGGLDVGYANSAPG